MRTKLLAILSIAALSITMAGCGQELKSTKHPPPGSVERREDQSSLLQNRLASWIARDDFSAPSRQSS